MRGVIVQVLEARVDHGRVVGILRKADHLPLVKEYLLAVQKANLAAVNEAVNELLIEVGAPFCSLPVQAPMLPLHMPFCFLQPVCAGSHRPIAHVVARCSFRVLSCQLPQLAAPCTKAY